MRSNRFWLEIIVLGTAVACVFALLLATLGVAAGAAGEQESAQPNPPKAAGIPVAFEGMITCSRCGAKHSPEFQRSASICVRECVHGGAQFVLIDADSTYLLEGDLQVLKKLAGQRARLTGNLQGQTIKVTSAMAGS